MAKRKNDRMNIRVSEDLKERFFAACYFKETDASEVLTRTMVAYAREAEKEMRERGVDIEELKKKLRETKETPAD